MRGLILLPAQILSAICAAAVADGIVPGDIATVQTTLAPNVSVAQGVFLEMVAIPIHRPNHVLTLQSHSS